MASATREYKDLTSRPKSAAYYFIQIGFNSIIEKNKRCKYVPHNWINHDSLTTQSSDIAE
jgi:hypothetical protein